MTDLGQGPIGDEALFRQRLLSAIKSSGNRRIAFVVGSGVTAPLVPGVSQMIQKMRAICDSETEESFDSYCPPTLGLGEQYRAAAEFITMAIGTEELNSVIQRAVLSAVRGGNHPDGLLDDEYVKKLEESGDWNLTKAARYLGYLATHIPAHKRGPIITTNFDPIIEVAIRKSGGSPRTHVLDDDGSFRAIDSGVVDVVHVHGFWRNSDTLHIAHELDKARPQLEDSIRRTLVDCDVFVIGYGGWNDVFTRTLVGRITASSMERMEVLWAAYRSFEIAVNEGILGDIYAERRVRLYCEVDANRALQYVASRLNADLPEPLDMDYLSGWVVIGQSFVRNFIDSADDSCRRDFFEGGMPDWKIAADDNIPVLSAARRLMGLIRNEQVTEDGRICALLVGPMGEGKSTSFMQTAIRLGTDPEFDVTVHWRQVAASVNVDDILLLPSGLGTHLLFIDDADLVIDQICELVDRLRSTERSDIRVVMCARERDWRISRGAQRLARHLRTVPASGVTESDAGEIASSWIGLIEDSSATAEIISSNILRASRRSRTSGGSLIGAMLQLRGQERFEHRVADLIARLERYLYQPDESLVVPFAMIATLSTELDEAATSISTRVLAEGLGLDEISVQQVILDQLGKEALTSQSGDSVRVRHPMIATAALSVLRRSDEPALLTAYRKIVTGALRDASRSGGFSSGHRAYAYLCNNLDIKKEALAAIDMAIDLDPKRLTYRTSRVKTFRRFDDIQGSYEYALSVYEILDTFDDRQSIPGFFTDWATSAGGLSHYAENVILDAAALAAIGLVSHLEERDFDSVRRALCGMAVGFTNLHEQSHNPDFAGGVSGCVDIVEELGPTRRQLEFCRKHRLYVEQQNLVANAELAGSVDLVLAATNLVLPRQRILQEWDIDSELPILQRVISLKSV